MRVAIVTGNARLVGGIESYLDTLIPRLEATGHQIALWCEFDTPNTSPPISRRADAPVWLLAQVGTARWLDSLRQWRPNVIFTHGLLDLTMEAQALKMAPAIAFAHDYRATCISGAKAFAFPATTPCARSFGAGCLVNFYPRRCGGLDPRTMIADFGRAARRLEILHGCHAVLTASEFVRAEYVRNGLAPDAVRCVGLPVSDFGGSLPEPADPSVDASTAKPLRLLYAGRMERLKGGRVLLDALPMVSSELSRPLGLTLAGDGRARLEWQRHADALVRRYPSLRVEFIGWVPAPTLVTVFDSSDLLVIPSLWPEPFGLVGVEAGMRGLPVAAFAAGGIPEWLTDGVNGALAYRVPRDPASLADAIARCVRDPVEYAQLRRGAIELAQRFRPEYHLRVLSKILEQASSQASPVEDARADSIETTPILSQ